MNKYQEAFGRIVDSSDMNVCVQDGEPMNQDTEDVLLIQELVDRETPKKPIKIEFKFTEEELEWITNEDDKYRYECPHCHIKECRRNVPDCWNDDYVYEMTKRCDECGGLLDWSENE